MAHFFSRNPYSNWSLRRTYQIFHPSLRPLDELEWRGNIQHSRETNPRPIEHLEQPNLYCLTIDLNPVEMINPNLHPDQNHLNGHLFAEREKEPFSNAIYQPIGYEAQCSNTQLTRISLVVQKALSISQFSTYLPTWENTIYILNPNDEVIGTRIFLTNIEEPIRR